MRPRMHVPLSPADRATIAMWSRRVLLVWAVIVASLVAYAFWLSASPRRCISRTRGSRRSPARLRRGGSNEHDRNASSAG